jgi:phage terminase large subunit GpA-like protein
MSEGEAYHAQALFEAWSSALRATPRLPFEEWAQTHIRNGDGTPFYFRPYQVAPAADLFNPKIASVALRAYSGAGKTYLFSVAYAYAIEQLKLKIGKMFPAENLSADWFFKKLMPILKETPVVASLPMIKDNVLFKAWENGAEITGVGANSAGRIRTLEVDVADADEIDAITSEIRDEGDKLQMFLRRTRGRKRQHHWLASYPSIIGGSKIDAAIDQSDGCAWFYDCPKCNESQSFHPKDIVWKQDKAHEAQVECPECAKTFTDKQRKESVLETGHFRDRDNQIIVPGELPSEQYGGRRGYHINCMAHVGEHADKFVSYLHEVAASAEQADRSENPKKARRVLINTLWAESYEEEYEEKADPEGLMADRDDYDPAGLLPEEITRIWAGADVNGKFIAVFVMGSGPSGFYGLNYTEIQGRWDSPQTWKALDQIRRRKWKHPNGASLGIRRLFIDSRFQKNTVQSWTKPRQPQVLAVMGSSALGAPALGSKRKDASTGANVMTLGVDELKDQVYDIIDKDTDTPFSAFFTDAVEDGVEMFGGEFFDGLLAEERDTKRARDGRVVTTFVHTEGAPRNEPLDCFAYALAAFKSDKRTEEAAKKALDGLANGQVDPEQPRPVRQYQPTRGIGRQGGWL